MTLTRLVHPSLVGFDRFNEIIDALDMVTDKPSFPHHNVVKSGENHYTVELAVAGFSNEDIDVEVEKNVLHIRGKIENEVNENKTYIHRGIATRSFHKTITLADTIQVKGADLINGILSIELENVIPEEQKPKKILIGKAKKELLTESN